MASMIPAIGTLSHPAYDRLIMETTATTRTASSRLQAGLEALRDIALTPDGDLVRGAALDVAEIVRSLDADDDVVMAAMIQPLLDGEYIDREAAGKRFGEEPVRLARALSQLGQFGLPADWTPDRPSLRNAPAARDAHDHHAIARALCTVNASGQVIDLHQAPLERAGLL